MLIELYVNTEVKTERKRKELTNASPSIRLDDNQHSDVTPENIPMLSHLTNYGSNTYTSVESLEENV